MTCILISGGIVLVLAAIGGAINDEAVKKRPDRQPPIPPSAGKLLHRVWYVLWRVCRK